MGFRLIGLGGRPPSFRKEALLKTKIALALLAGFLVAVSLGADGDGLRLTKSAHFNAYPVDRQNGAYRTGLTAVDDTDLATIAAATTIDSFVIGGRQTLSVTPRIGTSGATVTLTIVYMFTGNDRAGNDVTDEIVAIKTSAAFTGGSFNDDEHFLGATQLFDTYGATHCKIIVSTAPSAGTVDIHAGSY